MSGLRAADHRVVCPFRAKETSSGERLLSWPGERLGVRFQGRVARILGSAPGVVLEAMIDGRPGVLLEDLDGEALLARDLPEGMHTLEVVRMTEPAQGLARVAGFESDGSWFPGCPPQRRLLFLGDSITCGYGIQASPGSEGFRPGEESFGLSWAGVAARRLGAAALGVSQSGIGVWRNFDGSLEALPGLWRRLDFHRPEILVEPGQERFDAVVVNLGTNDVWLGDPDPGRLAFAWSSFLDELRTYHPGTLIVLALGPMLGDRVFPGDGPSGFRPVRSSWRRLLHSLVEGRGDPDLRFLELSDMDLAQRPAGADFHPGPLQAELDGQLLAAELGRRLG